MAQPGTRDRRRDLDTTAGPRAAPAPAWRNVSDLVAACAAIALLFGSDYASDTLFDVSLTYVFPVAWATWRVSRAAGASLSLVSALADTVADLHVGRYPRAALPISWNVSIQFTLLALAAWGVDRVRRGIERERALRSDLEVAHGRLDAEVLRIAELQRSLLPRETPTVPGHSIAVHYATSAKAGGDYYDFFPLEGGRLGVLVADASGHGPSAAVLMAMARVIVHRDRGAQPAPERLLEAANRGLVENILPHQFVTACYLVLDPRTGAVEFATAGHPLPLVRRGAAGSVEEVGVSDGPPLGLDDATRYRHQSTRLEPGDALVLYTDGLTEARHGDSDLLGEEAVQRCVAECGRLGAPQIVERLVARMDAHLHGASPDDDVTILVIEAARADAPRAG